jgi:hypothetical protein
MDWLEFKEKILDKTQDAQGLKYGYGVGALHPNRLPRRVISLGAAANDKIIKIPNWYKSVFETQSGCGYLWVEVISCKDSVFAGNENVTDIILPDNVFNIEQGSFAGCKNLKRIRISKRVHFIPEDTFKGCDNLEDVYFGGSEEEWEKVTVVHRKLQLKKPVRLGPYAELEYVAILGNEALLNSRIHFNCNLEEPHPPYACIQEQNEA